jgi:hypothetical protein
MSRMDFGVKLADENQNMVFLEANPEKTSMTWERARVQVSEAWFTDGGLSEEGFARSHQFAALVLAQDYREYMLELPAVDTREREQRIATIKNYLQEHTVLSSSPELLATVRFEAAAGRVSGLLQNGWEK